MRGPAFGASSGRTAEIVPAFFAYDFGVGSFVSQRADERRAGEQIHCEHQIKSSMEPIDIHPHARLKDVKINLRYHRQLLKTLQEHPDTQKPHAHSKPVALFHANKDIGNNIFDQKIRFAFV